MWFDQSKRLAGDTAREATSDEVKTLRAEARQLKEALAEVTLENRKMCASARGATHGVRMLWITCSCLTPS
jgi:hypothetical protein